MVVYERDRDHCPAFLATRKDARIVRLSAQVLWVAKEGAGEPPAVLIGRGDWADIRARCPGLRPFDALPRARRSDVLRAWRLDAPAPVRARGDDALLALLGDSLVACDGLEPTDAIAAVKQVLAWADAAPDEPVGGRIEPPGAPEDAVRTLYLDTQPTADWPAIALLGDAWTFAFAPGLVFLAEAAPVRDAGEEYAPALFGGRQMTFSFF